MDPSTWIALGALVVAATGPAIGTFAKSARRDGKVDAILEHLTGIMTDHEDRLRKGGL